MNSDRAAYQADIDADLAESRVEDRERGRMVRLHPTEVRSRVSTLEQIRREFSAEFAKDCVCESPDGECVCLMDRAVFDRLQRERLERMV